MADIKILPKVLPSDHFVLRVSDEVQKICEPLFSRTEITAFGYTRIYNDGARFVLFNRADWIEHCYNKGFVYATRLNRHPSCYQSGYFLWDAWAPDHPGHDLVGKDGAEFNLGRGISILDKTENYLDKFEFASTPNNYSINNFYINNLEFLQSFIDYFKSNAGVLITEAIKNRAIVPHTTEVDMFNDYADTQASNALLIKLDPNSSMKSTREIFHPALTIREKECLYWLIKGKTGPGIALILGISPRTVEKFIGSLKDKFGTNSLFQLGQRVSQLGLDKVLK